MIKTPISVLITLLICTACTHTPQLQKHADGYIDMPPRFLGFWWPHSVGGNQGLDVQPNTIFDRDLDDWTLVSHRANYKVFHADEKYVHLIVQRHMTVDYLDQTMGWSPEEREQNLEKFTKKHWLYHRYHLSYYVGNNLDTTYLLNIEKNNCGLTEEDWLKPAAAHQQNFDIDECDKKAKNYYSAFNYSKIFAHENPLVSHQNETF